MSSKDDLCVGCGRFKADRIRCDIADGMGNLMTCLECLNWYIEHSNNPVFIGRARKAANKLRESK